MAPEAIAPVADASNANGKLKLGRPADVWALGVILYQILYERLPFSDLSTIQKLHAIPNPVYSIDFPHHFDINAVTSVKACLQRDPKTRASIGGSCGLLNMPFLKIDSDCSQKFKIQNDSNRKENSCGFANMLIAPSEED